MTRLSTSVGAAPDIVVNNASSGERSEKVVVTDHVADNQNLIFSNKDGCDCDAKVCGKFYTGYVTKVRVRVCVCG